ncbi:MAG: hypothetical protein HY298_21025, partial [Verrucomicrobia bacterium]|nr:hypothetical protein [Verrucomicrobiota bacterium]
MKVVQSLLGIQDASATHPHRFPSRARNHHSRDCAALLWDSCRAGAKKSLLLAALSFFTLPLLAGAPPCLTITCPPNTNVQCAADAPAAATDSTSFTAQGGTITNTCGGSLTVSSTDAITSSNCPNSFTITRTYTVTDNTGPTDAICAQTITVNDITPPVFTTCPASTNLGCNPGSVPGCDFSPANVATTDSCNSPTLTCILNQATNGCVRTRTITYKATDNCGNTNTCTQVITWTVDTTPPSITCPADTTTQCGQTTPNFTGLATATDDCGTNLVITFSDAATPGTCPTNSTITRTWKATDACNNVATCDQFITVLATAPPVFTNCPASTNLGCNPASVPGCNPAVGTTADCATTVTCVLNQVTNGCSRTRTITYTAVDACNNTNTCTQVVTWTVDTTPPVFLSCPTGTTNMGCNPDPASIPHCLVSVQATDDCSTPHVTCSLVQTTNLLTCVRTRTVIYTATDACGNSTNCTQVITWTVDTTPPVFTKIPLASTNLGCNPASIPVCNLDPTNVFAIDDCPTNDIPVITCASVEATNGCVHTRTLTYTATGGCGNTATKTTVITWTEDTAPPVFTKCPTNMNLGCNPTNAIPDCDTSTNNVVATDNCGAPTVTCLKSDAVSGDGCVHTRTITYAATDACNNSNTCVQVITWTTDTIPPVFTRCPASTNLGCNPASIPNCNLLSTNVEAEDVCSTPVITCAQVDSTTGCAHTRTITYTVTDACGNSNTCTQLISWTEDTTPPTIICPANTTAECGQTTTNFTGVATATDSCDTNVVITFTDASTPGNCPTNNTITRTWKAADACNNMATCDQIITVVDTTPPVFTNCPASTNLGCNPASIPGCDLAVGATDNCGVPTVTCVLNQVTNGCARTRTISYTATDACGNTNTCTQTITWTVDTTPPVFLNCPTGTTNMGCNPDPASIPHCLVSVQATDNCSSPHVTCSLVQTTNLLTCVRTRTVIYTATDACGNSTN